MALLAAAAVGLGALVLFVHLERQGRAAAVFTVLLAELLVECVLYPDQSVVPVGLVHPGAGALSFRLAEFLVAVAIVARLVVRGAPSTVGVRMLWWAAFLVWMATAAVAGILAGNDAGLAAFEAKAVVYLGAMAIGAGVSLRSMAGEHSLLRLLRWSGGLAALLIVTDQAGIRLTFAVPLLPVQELGLIGGDLATVFSTLGALCVVLAATGRRIDLLAAAAVLFAASVASEQRAGMVAAGLTLVVVALGLTLVPRRPRVTGTELLLTTTLAFGLVVAPSLARVVAGEPARLPLAADLESAFSSTGKRQSAESRANQWDQAKDLILERPLVGRGLGTTYAYFQSGPDEQVETNLTHNLLTDVALRMGFVGLFLFLAATGLSLCDGWRAWRRHPDPMVAALALGAFGGIVGILGKAMFESIFEKYRIAILLGLLLGILRSAASSLASDGAGVPPEPAGRPVAGAGDEWAGAGHAR
ncbi:MAG: O-antigen ligase family protein [Actinomycetota bacterium]|nr:O-antigen ligase family protein [Actinomycetota bacterium]